MSQTNTEQCQDTSRGKLSHGDSRGTHWGKSNRNCDNRPFFNSSLVEKLTKNYISYLSITKGGPRSIHLKKILEAKSAICQAEHYDYIPAIISTNTKTTQEYFLSNRPIKRRSSSKHHVKLRFVDPIIGLDVPSGNSPIDSGMVEYTPIFNLSPQEQHCLDYDQESNAKSKECYNTGT